MSRRILIVRLSAIGDTALTLPLLFSLRSVVPTAYIGWVVGERAAPLLEDLPQIDRLHIWKQKDMNLVGYRRLIREVREGAYEISLDPQGILVSGFIPFAARIPKRAGFARHPLEGRECSFLLTNLKLSPPKELTHVSYRSCWLGRAVDGRVPVEQPVILARNAKAEARVRAWWDAQGLSERTLVFGIGAGWRTKIWPPREMSILVKEAEKRGYRCVVVWGPEEEARLAEWRSQLSECTVWAPPTDLREMVELLRLSWGHVGPDSAPLHIAWLLSKPTFSWFGASSPARSAPPGRFHSSIARGPHTYRRKRFSSEGLHTLKGEEALPAFRAWLSRNNSRTSV
jgi:ADP-heptose:LPS heptosyltransferase